MFINLISIWKNNLSKYLIDNKSYFIIKKNYYDEGRICTIIYVPQEYLEWEEQQPIKYEYVNGEVFAMTGETLPHNSVALNLASALKNHLRDKGCKVFMADAKLGVSDIGPFHYPDVMVTCDKRDQNSPKIVHFPCLIVEVLSTSSFRFCKI